VRNVEMMRSVTDGRRGRPQKLNPKTKPRMFGAKSEEKNQITKYKNQIKPEDSSRTYGTKSEGECQLSGTLILETHTPDTSLTAISNLKF
jgi:hypothetical protein